MPGTSILKKKKNRSRVWKKTWFHPGVLFWSWILTYACSDKSQKWTWEDIILRVHMTITHDFINAPFGEYSKY